VISGIDGGKAPPLALEGEVVVVVEEDDELALETGVVRGLRAGGARTAAAEAPEAAGEGAPSLSGVGVVARPEPRMPPRDSGLPLPAVTFQPLPLGESSANDERMTRASVGGGGAGVLGEELGRSNATLGFGGGAGREGGGAAPRCTPSVLRGSLPADDESVLGDEDDDDDDDVGEGEPAALVDDEAGLLEDLYKSPLLEKGFSPEALRAASLSLRPRSVMSLGDTNQRTQRKK